METTDYKKNLRITSITFTPCEYWENGEPVIDPITKLKMNTEYITLKGKDATLKGANPFLCQDVFTVVSIIKPEELEGVKAGINVGDIFSAMIGIIPVAPFHRIMNGNIICDHAGVPKIYNSILVQNIWTETKSAEQIAMKMREDGIKKGQMCELSVPEPEPVAPTSEPVTGAAPAQQVAQRRPF